MTVSTPSASRPPTTEPATPYPFFDPGEVGVAGVTTMLTVLLVVAVVFAGVLLLLDRAVPVAARAGPPEPRRDRRRSARLRSDGT
ncbi:hypothetical protein [Aquipuribacter nitratireducens]|uniref:Uncharacterized protein n=1 Tax=Aquipuribacter nitratireducens TaxID=650104 RepID=A0ABW0GR04_9MICO